MTLLIAAHGTVYAGQGMRGKLMVVTARSQERLVHASTRHANSKPACAPKPPQLASAPQQPVKTCTVTTGLCSVRGSASLSLSHAHACMWNTCMHGASVHEKLLSHMSICIWVCRPLLLGLGTLPMGSESGRFAWVPLCKTPTPPPPTHPTHPIPPPPPPRPQPRSFRFLSAFCERG